MHFWWILDVSQKNWYISYNKEATKNLQMLRYASVIYCMIAFVSEKSLKAASDFTFKPHNLRESLISIILFRRQKILLHCIDFVCHMLKIATKTSLFILVHKTTIYPKEGHWRRFYSLWIQPSFIACYNLCVRSD